MKENILLYQIDNLGLLYEFLSKKSSIPSQNAINFSLALYETPYPLIKNDPYSNLAHFYVLFSPARDFIF